MNNIRSLVIFQVKQIMRMSYVVLLSNICLPIIFLFAVLLLKDLNSILYLCAYFLILQCLYITFSYTTVNESQNIEKNVVKRLSVTPISSVEYLVSNIISQYIFTFLGLTSIILIAIILGEMPINFAIQFFILFTIMFILFYNISFIIAHVLKDVSKSKSIGSLIYIIMIISVMLNNNFLNIPAKVIGLFYFKSIFISLINSTFHVLQLVPILILIIIYSFIAIRIFRWN